MREFFPMDDNRMGDNGWGTRSRTEELETGKLVVVVVVVVVGLVASMIGSDNRCCCCCFRLDTTGVVQAEVVVVGVGVGVMVVVVVKDSGAEFRLGTFHVAGLLGV